MHQAAGGGLVPVPKLWREGAWSQVSHGPASWEKISLPSGKSAWEVDTSQGVALQLEASAEGFCLTPGHGDSGIPPNQEVTTFPSGLGTEPMASQTNTTLLSFVM